MAVNSRQKGKVGELEFAKFLREHGYAGARRGQQFKGGTDSPDVVGLDGFHTEVKRTEALRLYDALDQAKNDAGAGKVPVVAHRKNKERWVAILDMEDFLALLVTLGLEIPDAAREGKAG